MIHVWWLTPLYSNGKLQLFDESLPPTVKLVPANTKFGNFGLLSHIWNLIGIKNEYSIDKENKFILLLHLKYTVDFSEYEGVAIDLGPQRINLLFSDWIS